MTECLQWMWINEGDGNLKDAVTYKNLVEALEALKTLIKLQKELKFAPNSRDQWEVMEVDNIHYPTLKWFIRRLKRDPDKT